MTHRLHLRTLTPVHVGSGTDYQGNIEYLVFARERQIAVIDEAKVLQVIGTENMDQWLAIINNRTSLLDYLKKRNPDLQPEDIARHILHIPEGVDLPKPENALKACIRGGTQQQPYLPGSSLKGSVRTAILTHLIKKDQRRFVSEEKNLKDRFSKRLSDKDLDNHYLAAGYQGQGETPNRDILRLLRISDCAFDARTICITSRILNLEHKGWKEKRRERSYWECLPAGVTAQGTLQIPEELRAQIIKERYMYQNIGDLKNAKTLFERINDHTLHLVQEEIGFWKEEAGLGDISEEGEGLLEKLEDLQRQIQACDTAQTCVLRVGAGSGWLFMTGGWAKDPKLISDDLWDQIRRSIQRKTYDDMPAPKTRKFTDGSLPFGFVQISLI
ncbi:MAG: type III-A CRISPR-associated RAMP protein Csm5 [Bernardetiaceae bacterium]